MLLSEVTNLEYSITLHGNAMRFLSSLRSVLESKGYGVLSFIDAGKVIAERTGKDIGIYFILDVCKPDYALSALSLNMSVSLLLPCKIIFRGSGEEVRISLLRPTATLSILREPRIQILAQQVEDEFIKIMNEAFGSD